MRASELPDTVLHFAAPDACRGICMYGMRPARQILEDAGLSEGEVLALTTEPRSDFTYLPANDKSDAVRLAHNKPLMNGSSAVLEKCLAKGAVHCSPTTLPRTPTRCSRPTCSARSR